MPMHKPRARLTWRGKDTVREILGRLHRRERTLVTLPAGFHHALTVSVSGDGEIHGPVDVPLNDAAFDRLVRITGLRALAELRDPLARAGMDVRVCTPPPRIRLVPVAANRCNGSARVALRTTPASNHSHNSIDR